jgi:multicomponent Na+:H+ antiporter subunit B
MIGLIIISIFITLIVLSILIISNRDLAHSVILFMGFGLWSVILFFLFSAPDVALTEAVIGTGISSVVLLVTLLQVRGKELKR